MTQKLKLLIVDDSFIIRQAIKKYLKKYNLEVVGTAENGKVALELFEKTNPDIVTLDITMKTMIPCSVSMSGHKRHFMIMMKTGGNISIL